MPPGDPRLGRAETRVIAAPSQSLAAAAEREAAGLSPRPLGDALEGEARELAAEHVALAVEMQEAMEPGDMPIVLLSGGECTVSGRGSGIGGPNAEFALASAWPSADGAGIHAIACDTDGVDGAAEVAGALVGPRPRTGAGLRPHPQAALAEHDSQASSAPRVAMW